MAADAEYGDSLKAAGIIPFITGVGPINAAMNMMAVLKDLERDGHLPDLVINIGSAGSRDLPHKAIVQAVSIGYRDMDASPFGFAKGVTPFSDLPALLPIKAIIPGLPETTISTGGAIIGGAAYDNLGAQTAEMEAYGAYSACLHFGIPMLKIVGISDGQKDLTGELETWTQYLRDIDRGLAAAIVTLKNGLAGGSIDRENLLSLPEALSRCHSV